ncbi:MAG: ubiquinone/menaquinone biosynthesis methyltransferase [Planctomycetota bacterium]|jgi:demethylmenaquinone methyltransferase/2-methoxy-6-polyprenyl-1,4-benzoquinol methylase
MSEAVRSMFAGIASRYDLANRLLSAGRDVAWRRAALRRMHTAPGRLLDLACGTGDFGIDALRQGAARTVIGADFCLPMIQAGRTKFAAHGIHTSTGDALALPFADASFDAAMIAYGWRNVDDKARALAELHRVVRPGGEIVILEFFRPTTWWPRLFHATFGRHLIPLIGGLLTGKRDAYSYLYTSIQGFLSLPEAATLVSDAGFAEPEVMTCFGGVSHALICRRP